MCAYGLGLGACDEGSFCRRDESGTFGYRGVCEAREPLCAQRGCYTDADCTDATAESCARTLLATEGTLEITTVGADGERFIGNISDVQFEEVTINADTYLSTPVAGGERRCVDGHDPVEVPPPPVDESALGRVGVPTV